MLKSMKPRSPVMVDLTENILLCTAIPQENHAALRAGFAGYPPNPRWNITKFRAWKTGRQLKESLKRGDMLVRSSDRILVPAVEAGTSSDEEARSPLWMNFFPAKQLSLA